MVRERDGCVGHELLSVQRHAYRSKVPSVYTGLRWRKASELGITQVGSFNDSTIELANVCRTKTESLTRDLNASTSDTRTAAWAKAMYLRTVFSLPIRVDRRGEAAGLGAICATEVLYARDAKTQTS